MCVFLYYNFYFIFTNLALLSNKKACSQDMTIFLQFYCFAWHSVKGVWCHVHARNLEKCNLEGFGVYFDEILFEKIVIFIYKIIVIL